MKSPAVSIGEHGSVSQFVLLQRMSERDQSCPHLRLSSFAVDVFLAHRSVFGEPVRIPFILWFRASRTVQAEIGEHGVVYHETSSVQFYNATNADLGTASAC